MSYPLSSAVVEGQATEAAQYNNLRADALCLGGTPGASGSVRDLLFSAAGAYTLRQNGKTTIVLDASESAPVGLMIGGNIYTVTAALSLLLSASILPDPGRYRIYANGQNGGAFVLSLFAGEKPREIGTFCWDGSGIIPGTLRTSADSSLLTVKNPAAASGRLSLVAGDPVPDTDITLGESLYFVPYHGSEIALNLFGEWEFFSWSMISLGNNGLTRGIPYDVFLSVDSDGLALSAVSWGSVTTRPAGSLAWLDGVRVSGSDASKRFLGSFVLNSSGYFEDSRAGRLLWNENNRLQRPILSKLITTKNQGTTHLNSWAPYYDEDAPIVRALIPVSDCDLEIVGVGMSSPISESDRSYGRASAIGIGRDIMHESPYTGNESCAPVFTHTFGNGPEFAEIHNFDDGFVGYHSFTLIFWSNYSSLYPVGTNLSNSCGECPGLFGSILA